MPREINDSKESTLKGNKGKQKPSAEPPQEQQIKVDLANAPIVAVHFLQVISRQNAEILKLLLEAKANG